MGNSKTETINNFRKELLKIMPGYKWTIHKPNAAQWIEATGTMSSGFARVSTLHVLRKQTLTDISYEVKSSGYGLRAPWIASREDGTLSRALRSLQTHYETMNGIFRSAAEKMQDGRNV